jgi:hypothetical protein
MFMKRRLAVAFKTTHRREGRWEGYANVRLFESKVLGWESFGTKAGGETPCAAERLGFLVVENTEKYLLRSSRKSVTAL